MATKKKPAGKKVPAAKKRAKAPPKTKKKETADHIHKELGFEVELI